MDAFESARAYWKSKNIESEADLDLALYSFRVLFAYHSGIIENGDIQYHVTRDIFENGCVTGNTGPPRARCEQQNQKLCHDFLLGKIIAREHLSVELVRDIHRILTAGTFHERRFIEKGERPGEFKKHDYVTGRLEVGYPPEEVSGALNELFDELNGFKGSDTLRAAAYRIR